MRKFKYGCGVIAQNFLLNYSLFKITANPSKKVEFSSEKQKDMSVDGTYRGKGGRYKIKIGHQGALYFIIFQNQGGS